MLGWELMAHNGELKSLNEILKIQQQQLDHLFYQVGQCQKKIDKIFFLLYTTIIGLAIYIPLNVIWKFIIGIKL